MNAHIVLNRFRDNGLQTLGRAWVLINGSKKMEFVTLEPSWLLNEHKISCIPVETYEVEKRHTAKFGDHFHVLEVPDRSYILLHSLNFFNQTEGCIGVGEGFSRLNEDQNLDIKRSRATLDKLYKVMPDTFQLTVKEDAQFQTMYYTPHFSIAIGDLNNDNDD